MDKIEMALKILQIVNAGAGTGVEIAGIITRNAAGEVDVVEGLDRAGKKFQDVRDKVSKWKTEHE